MKQVKAKVIKLNSRYILYKKYRFEHAVRFDRWDVESRKLEMFLRERYGNEYGHRWDSDFVWKTHWGKARANESRPFFIGVRDEEMIFVAQLAGAI